jgi:hypothetical protein
MAQYVRAQSAGEIIRGSFEIYLRNFPALFLTFSLPLFPFTVLEVLAEGTASRPLYWTTFNITLLIEALAFVPMTIVISNICLGNRPSVALAYRHALGNLGPVLITYLLQLLILVAGLLLLVLPGVIFLLWTWFALTVAVLEGVSGIDAFKRSKALGAGFYLRNAGILFLLVVILILAIGITEKLLTLTSTTVLGHPPALALAITNQIMVYLFVPIIYVGLVLLYYDMRARKEGYDTAALAEDLRR